MAFEGTRAGRKQRISNHRASPGELVPAIKTSASDSAASLLHELIDVTCVFVVRQ